MRKLKFEYDAVLKNVDLLVMPTLPWVAKKLLVRGYDPSNKANAEVTLQPADAPPLTQLKDYDGLVRATYFVSNGPIAVLMEVLVDIEHVTIQPHRASCPVHPMWYGVTSGGSRRAPPARWPAACGQVLRRAHTLQSCSGVE